LRATRLDQRAIGLEQSHLIEVVVEGAVIGIGEALQAA